MTSVSDRVSNGVAWLNHVHPGWRDKIDTQILNMENGDVCILGQLGLWESTAMGIVPWEDVVELGFDVLSLDGVSYEDLQTEWVKELGELA